MQFDLKTIKRQSLLLYLNRMKQLSMSVISSLSEFILFCRNHSDKGQVQAKLEEIQKNLSQMRQKKAYSMESFSTLLDRENYSIAKRLSSKEYRVLSEVKILIKFKIADKGNSNVIPIESWLVSILNVHPTDFEDQRNYDEEAIGLLSEVVRSLRCQFLSLFASGSQQLKNKYFVDYEVEFNPSKKSLAKLSLLNYSENWKKSAKIDMQSRLTVSCFHNQHSQIKSIIEGNRRQNSSCTFNRKYVKHGSEDTKPSLSDEFDLSSSGSDQSPQSRSRASSVIQFFDADLNITVLSNDSGSFKKSTGKIEGVYISKTTPRESEKSVPAEIDDEADSDGEFQLLIQESIEPHPEVKKENSFLSAMSSIEAECFKLFDDMTETSQAYFNL